jgi:hypothetical protein
LQLAGQRGPTPEESADLDAVALIGSDGWAAENHPDVTPLLISAPQRGAVVGGIYAGAEHYRDVPYAVADGRLVSAPGTAPLTFATAFLGALYPEQREQIAQMHTSFADEHRAASAWPAAGAR